MISLENIDELRSKVTEAEEARKRGGGRQIEDIWMALSTSELVKTEGVKGAIAVALLGIARIRHADANAEMRIDIKRAGEIMANRIDPVLALYATIAVNGWPETDIFGSETDWRLETAQDLVNTLNITGRNDEALEVIDNALAETASGKRAATISARGVLLARKFKLTNKLSDLLTGLRLVNQAYDTQPNPHRLASMAGRTVRYSLDNNVQANGWERIEGMIGGMWALGKAFISNPRDTLLALKI